MTKAYFFAKYNPDIAYYQFEFDLHEPELCIGFFSK